MSHSSITTASLPVPQPVDPSRTAHEANAEFEGRWNAWVARGRHHDLAVRRRIRVALLAAVIIGSLAGLTFGLMAGVR